MSSKALTDLSIQRFPLSDKQYEMFDSKVTGLGVRVSPGGRKSFIYIYRFRGQSRRMTLGAYPQLTLQQARQQAREFAHQLMRGLDPRQELIGQQDGSTKIGFETLVDDFIENSAKRTTRSWKEVDRILRKQFLPRWRTRTANEINKQMVHAALDGIVKSSGPSAGNHAFAAVRRCFNYAVERGYLDSSPCSGMKQPAKTRERERVLDDRELAAIWHAATAIGYPFGSFVQLLSLTAQRRSEVARMQWKHVDLDTGIWSQPGDANKSGQRHDVPLSDQVIRLLTRIPRISDAYVFPARGSNNPISGFSRWKAGLERRSRTSDWTLHDLRRTAATGMARLGVPLHVIELTLNHRSGQLSGIARVYNRHEYLDEQRDALQRWADRLDAVIGAHAEHVGGTDQAAACQA